MKTSNWIFTAAIGIACLSAQIAAGAVEEVRASEKAAAVGMLPHQKRGLEVDPNERNPFAHRVEAVKTTATKDRNSEEAKIRAVLAGLPPSGITNGTNGLRAMAGGIIFEVGRNLPQLIPGQTDRLKVTKVTAKSIEITWVDEEGAEEPRKHVIDLDLSPRIKTVLPGSNEEGRRLHPIDPSTGSGPSLPSALANGVASPPPTEDGE